LKNLIWNEPFARKVLPFVKDNYFLDQRERTIFEKIQEFIFKYNAPPSKESLAIAISDMEKVREDEVQAMLGILDEIAVDREDKSDQTWLLDSTEKFCQEKAIYNAVLKSISILDDKDEAGALTKGAIPQLLTEALAVSFDPNVGHDYLQDSDARFDFYHKKELRIPFDLEYLNKVTNGGLPRKTLNILLAGTGVGKSLVMCHMAAANLVAGYNVLYITAEMAQEKIAERIDANLLNIDLDDLVQMPKDLYDRKLNKIKEMTTGKLIIKEFPTASASVINFRALLNELRLKKSFVPDIIYVDYLNICASARIKAGANVNSYTYIKAIAEELRGLAVEFNIPIVSATQTTRAGFSSTDVELTDTSESFGLPATADFMMAIISTEDLEKLGQLMFKQLKNRYNDPTLFKRFVVGVDRAKMKLFDVEQSAQEDIQDSGNPVMNNSAFAQRMIKDKLKDFKI